MSRSMKGGNLGGDGLEEWWEVENTYMHLLYLCMIRENGVISCEVVGFP